MSMARPITVVAGAFAMAACVTINIYFPAAAAEKAADRIIQDVWGQQPQRQEQPPAGEQPEGQGTEAPPAERGALDREQVLARAFLDFVVPPARAAQADINVETPAIRRLKAAMKERHEALEPYYRDGAIGLNRQGLVEIRDLGAVPLRERKRLQQLVANENADRNALYREIAEANGHPEWREEIRKTFAERWIANAPEGWWYRDTEAKWRVKK
ncbi:MAG: YdbL family protein [Gammaproteobacteria bacterium]|nr:YdbL family protein [Gammaproteobacteria bacterium]